MRAPMGWNMDEQGCLTRERTLTLSGFMQFQPALAGPRPRPNLRCRLSQSTPLLIATPRF